VPLLGLTLGPAAVEFLDSLPPGKLRAQIAKKAKALLIEPFPQGCKKLVDVIYREQPVWRVRVRDYRILYTHKKDEVVVIDIDHRKNIYR
jgi:mRNA interferase RelE/StbE